MEHTINVSKPVCPACGGDIEVHETTVEFPAWDGVAIVNNEVTVKLSSVVFCTRCEWCDELHLVHLEAA
jgi:hypothetical protein